MPSSSTPVFDEIFNVEATSGMLRTNTMTMARATPADAVSMNILLISQEITSGFSRALYLET